MIVHRMPESKISSLLSVEKLFGHPPDVSVESAMSSIYSTHLLICNHQSVELRTEQVPDCESRVILSASLLLKLCIHFL